MEGRIPTRDGCGEKGYDPHFYVCVQLNCISWLAADLPAGCSVVSFYELSLF